MKHNVMLTIASLLSILSDLFPGKLFQEGVTYASLYSFASTNDRISLTPCFMRSSFSCSCTPSVATVSRFRTTTSAGLACNKAWILMRASPNSSLLISLRTSAMFRSRHSVSRVARARP